MRRLPRPHLGLVVLLVCLFGLLMYASSRHPVGAGATRTQDFSQLVDRVRNDPRSVQRVVFDPNSRQVALQLSGGTQLLANYPSDGAEVRFQSLLESKRIDFTAKPTATGGGSWLGAILGSLLPLVLLAAFWIFILRRAQAGGSQIFNFGRSRAKRVSPDMPKIGFKDVAGVDEAVEELEEIKEFLRTPRKFRALGASIPKGVLLYGPPGTGKTLLARAVAGEAGVPFFSISGSDFVEMFVGVGASRVRDLFDQAKKAAPCIVFVDEIDAVGRHRGTGLGGGHDEREQTLNQLLVEMDGFDANQNVVVVAATNRPDILDPALLRPGRFDRQIAVDRPDRRGRRAILEVHAKGKPLARDVDLDLVAASTPGFTGADLANLMNEAALLAARRGKQLVGQAELDEGVLRVIAGPERKTRLLSESERKITAYHELGHALVGRFLDHTDEVQKISIVSRGRALGYTISLPTEERYLQTRSALMDQLAMTLGGRSAEELVFHEVTSGAADDLERATQIARQMLARLGMSEKLGPRVLGRDESSPFLGRDVGGAPPYSEAVARELDEEIRRVIEEAHDRARGVLEERVDDLHRLAEILIERETLERGEFERLLAGEDAAAVFGDAAPAAPAPSSVAVRAPEPWTPSPNGGRAEDDPPGRAR